jgi:predicted PolB exonuclease-like 3'-5' exonuclease
MPKIIKYYIDIGCVYECDGTVTDAYKSFQCWDTKKYGVIGVLKLRLDAEKRTKEEIFFKQTFSPYVNKFAKDLIKDVSCDIIKEFREYQDEDLVVTWNGRDFDLPIIINNISISKEYREYYLDCISKKDRDLLDVCILREIDVKGGLQEVIKRLKIGHNLGNKFFPKYDEGEERFLTDLYVGANKYNNYVKLAKHRNEFDVRMLPLLEEKLGYLYEPRSYFDKFHKKWM